MAQLTLFAMVPSCNCRHSAAAGFTIIELIIVIVVLGILAVYASVHSVSTADANIPSQVSKLATDLRHAQTLASTWGQSLVFSASGSAYSVSCQTASTTSPCNVSPVTDPATGSSFSQTLQSASFSAATSVTFDSQGTPSAAATFTLVSTNGATGSATVDQLTGRISP